MRITAQSFFYTLLLCLGLYTPIILSAIDAETPTEHQEPQKSHQKISDRMKQYYQQAKERANQSLASIKNTIIQNFQKHISIPYHYAQAKHIFLQTVAQAEPNQKPDTIGRLFELTRNPSKPAPNSSLFSKHISFLPDDHKTKFLHDMFTHDVVVKTLEEEQRKNTILLEQEEAKLKQEKMMQELNDRVKRASEKMKTLTSAQNIELSKRPKTNAQSQFQAGVENMLQRTIDNQLFDNPNNQTQEVATRSKTVTQKKLTIDEQVKALHEERVARDKQRAANRKLEREKIALQKKERSEKDTLDALMNQAPTTNNDILTSMNPLNKPQESRPKSPVPSLNLSAINGKQNNILDPIIRSRTTRP